MLFASVTYTCNLEGKRNCAGDYADTDWCSYLSKKMRVNFRFLKALIKNKIKAVDYTYIFFRFFRTLSTASWFVMPILWPFQEENDFICLYFISFYFSVSLRV